MNAMNRAERCLFLILVLCSWTAVASAQTTCVGGMAGAYPCKNVDLESFVSLAAMGGGEGNDSWGWTDPATGDEYALMGMSNGMAIVKITDPVNPVYMGKLPKHAGSTDSSWRDIKVYQDHAFVVADQAGNHGMQVFDLTQLRNVTNPPVTFSETAWYGGHNLKTAHNIVIDEGAGYAYAVGLNSSSCSSQGMQIIDISTPTSPSYVSCYDGDGYTHDAECLVYNGPDTSYQGHEICFNANEDTVTMLDVTNKGAIQILARKGYPGVGYSHQGWLTEGQDYFLLDDELDEYYFGHNTRTRVFDVTSLTNPVLVGFHDSPLPASDHNQYVKGNFVYQSNYRAGLRILDISGVATAALLEWGYFDIYPSSDANGFAGAWNVYPYFPSGNVIISGIEQGLFVVRPRLCNLTLSPPSLPSGRVGNAYSQTISATGGSSPYSFAVTAGSLPPGLTLASTGLLSGTPTTQGVYPFTVSATDQLSCVQTKPYTLTIDPAGCPAITISPATLPAGVAGAAYNQTLAAAGGTPPYSFAVTAGTLPPGLTLSSGGVISGTPTSVGTFSFTATATDAGACTGSRAYSLVINSSSCPTITVAPATLPVGLVNTAYSQALTAGGGTAPYTFAVTSGTLPPGISLSQAGLLAGTPTAAGAFPFTVTATDSTSCSGAQPYVLDIDSPLTKDFVLGEGLGAPNGNRVLVYTGSALPTGVDFFAYGAGRWGVNVSSGDLNGGSSAEILTAPGPGTMFGPQIRAFRRDGTGMGKINFYAYGTLRFGANVGAGLLDADLEDEILSGAGAGNVFGPHVRGFDFGGQTLAAMSKVSFFAYKTLKYGVNVVATDLDADGYHEVLTGPGPGSIFGPQARGFNYDEAQVVSIGKINFNAYQTPNYGLNIGAGDMDADGYGEILTAPGPGSGSAFQTHVRGFNYDDSAVALLKGFDITPFTTSYGGRVAAGNINATTMRHANTDELIVSAGQDSSADSTVEAWHYDNAQLTQLPNQFVPFAGDTYGVNIAAGMLGY